MIEDMPPSESARILKELNAALCDFGIHHTTLQFEHIPCMLSDQGCRMSDAALYQGHQH